ncbi:branched-chain amino acid ABC transporter permease [Salinigranum marinum]|uniref:branched-chain amino acid ABC transporter permease n=1 Tax=Salinigranum marinum TaxID=1515595 RepID=UPI00298A003F|nr:branched-chain amino acid ABC transporter permease [Salinigranum marinum]
MRDVASALARPPVYLGIALVIAAAFLPGVLATKWVHLLILTYIITVAAISWNLIGGFGGQISLGNSVFFGLTGYSIGILMVTFELPYIVAFAVGMVLTVMAALVIGYPSFKLTGHYFALATITVVEGMRFLARYFRDFTGGERGFSLVPATVTGDPLLNLSQTGHYRLALGLLVVAFLMSVWFRYSKIGYYMMAIRDDQVAASSLGIDVPRYKMYTWLLCAVLTGLAGAMYATYIQYLDPQYMFSVNQSVLYAITPVIGGAGTLLGPIIGTFLVFPMQHMAITEFGGAYGSATYMVYGALLIVLIVYAPDGVLPKLRFIGEWVNRHAPRRAPAESEASSTESPPDP